MQKDYPTTEMAVNEPTKSFRRLCVPYFRTNAVEDKQEQVWFQGSSGQGCENTFSAEHKHFFLYVS